MNYEVRCECGKAHAVTGSDAGSSLRCACGRTVEVPALHVLRASTGEQNVSPIIQIQSGFLSGELPGPRKCVCCYCDTDRQIRISVVCEQASESERGAVAGVVASTALTGCLLLLTGIFVFSWIRESAPSTEHDTGLSVTVPIFLCESCDRAVTTVPAIRKALKVTPAYAALLERYPDALVRRLG